MIALPHCDMHEYYSSSTYRSPFRSLVLELSFLTADARIDASEEEGSSSMTSTKPVSVHLHNTMVGHDASYPFKDSFVAGLVL